MQLISKFMLLEATYLITIALYTILFFLTVLNNFRSRSNLSFALMLFGIWGWAATLYLYFFVDVGEYLRLVGRLNYTFGVFMYTGLAYFFYHFPKKTFTISPIWGYLLTVESVILALVSGLTPLINKDEIMTPDGPVMVLGDYYIVSFLHTVLCIAIAIFFIVKQFKLNQDTTKKKIIVTLPVFIIMSAGLTFMNVFLPVLGLQDQFIYAIFFPLPMALVSFYAIQKYRFLDIRFEASRTFKRLLSLFLTSLVGYFSYIIFAPHLPEIALYMLIILLVILTWQFTSQFLNSSTFHKIFGVTNVEHFQKTLQEFKNKESFYKTFSDLQHEIENTFVTKLRIQSARLFPLKTKRDENHYPELIKYFHKKNEVLVTKEILARQTQEELSFPFTSELTSLGEVVLPLFRNPQKIIALLVLGEKQFSDPYSSEEIKAIEGISHYLSLSLSSTFYHHELQREIKAKTKDLLQKNKEMGELLAQQQDFIAVSAHELRTPLNIALLQAESAALDKNDEDIKSIQISLSRLKNLVQRLFDVQKYDLNKAQLTFSRVRAHEFFQTICKEYQSLMRENNLNFSCDISLPSSQIIKIDPTQLNQVLQNLLSNALNFVPQGKSVHLEILQDTKNLLIKVIDTGHGIPRTDRQAIFKKFKSNHPLEGKGIGLGLYICEKIVHLHKGKIKVETTPGGGATFVISLPQKFLYTS